MKFLDYVCSRLLGPPVYVGDDYGTWSCPQHEDNHPSFRTLPSKEGCKDRFKCDSCQFWGDEYDLLKLIYDKENYGDRVRRLKQLREDWERTTGPTAKPSVVLSYPRTGITKVKTAKPDLDNAWAGLMEDLRDWETGEYYALQILDAAAKHCRENNTTVEDLVEYWSNFEEWSSEFEASERRAEKIKRAVRNVPRGNKRKSN